MSLASAPTASDTECERELECVLGRPAGGSTRALHERLAAHGRALRAAACAGHGPAGGGPDRPAGADLQLHRRVGQEAHLRPADRRVHLARPARAQRRRLGPPRGATHAHRRRAQRNGGAATRGGPRARHPPGRDPPRERKPLLDDAEFYVGRPLPSKLKAQLDANDASADAQRTLLQNQQVEVLRIDKLYDTELERLRKLWAGAQPGTLGTLAGTAASAPHK